MKTVCTLISSFIFFSILAFVGNCVHIADYAKKDVLPIIDAHMHLNRDMSAERLIALMASAGVEGMVLMARYYSGNEGGDGSDEQALYYAEKYPGRFIPFIAGQHPMLGRGKIEEWTELNNAIEWAEDFKSRASSGNFHGIGEFIIYHHAYTVFGNQPGYEVDLPLDSYLMHEIAKIGAEYNLPVLIHLEGEPDRLVSIIQLLKEEANTNFIWAHSCGRISARQIRELLTRFPNLHCDLGGMDRTTKGGYGNYWPRYTRWIHLIEDGTGRLYPEMKKLYEDFSDRFLIGTDCAHTPALLTYKQRIRRFRHLLSQLPPETARRLAYKNAEDLFGLKK